MTADSDRPTKPDASAVRERLVAQRLAGKRRLVADHRRSGDQPSAGQRNGSRSIPRADRSQPLLLSFDQQRLLFLSQLEPDSTAYLVPVAYRIRGAVDVSALQHAWAGLVGRHEILRTRYQPAGPEPTQIIDPPPDVAIPITDLTGLPAADREAQAMRLAAYEADTPIDICAERPARLRLVRLAPDDHLLVVVLHHIASDETALSVLTGDLCALYNAAVTGTQPSLPALPVQYADYAAWQRARLCGAALERELGYWRARLDRLTPLELPTDRPRSAVRGWAGDRVTLTVPAALAARLRAIAREHNATVFAVLLTTFQMLLARLTGQRDITVGSAVAQRNHPQLKRVAGFFLNTLVLRAAWDGDPSFGAFIDRTRADVVAALDHQEVPLHRLVDAVQKDRDLSRTPLFQVMFDMVEVAHEPLNLADLSVRQVGIGGKIAKFDLTLQLGSDADGSMAGVLEYSTDLFDRATAERMAANYLRLLESAAADPDAPLSELDILPASERQLLLREWNDTALSRPWLSVPAAIASQAALSPDAIAVAAGPQRVSYADLDARANRLAHHLRGLGVGQETVVGVCLDRSPDLIVALLAVWKAGGAYLPLDPAHPGDRIGYMLADAGAAVVVTDSAAAAVAARSYLGPRVLVDTDRAAIDTQPSHRPAAEAAPESLAYVVYTSGTTGRPKGVLISHAGLANYLDWTAGEYLGDCEEGVPLFASVAFDLVVPSLYTALMTGRCVYLMSPGYEADELGGLLAASAPYAFVKLTPAHLDLLARQLSPAQAAGLARTVVVAGDAFSSHLLDRWRRLTDGSQSRMVNEYGPTEITVGNSAYLVAGPQPTELMPIGKPIPNTTAYVLDADLRPMPIGVTGELYVGGRGVARGYRNRPALTAERFMPDPYGTESGGRLYKTGDLARVLPGGGFEFAGRTDDQVKIRGYRIEPAEVEAVLTGHPQVSDAVVAARDGQLVGYLIAVGNPPGADELRAYLAGRLPEYMIPARFLVLDAYPLSANGKVDRRALPSADSEALRPSPVYVPPRTDLEQQIAAAWRAALGAERVGVHDSFFDLGGDSIRAIGVVGALRDAGLDVTMRDLFQERTVAKLAEFVTGQPALARQQQFARPFELLDEADVARLPAGIVDAYPLSQVQAGMVYEMFSDPDAPYHNGTSYHVTDGRQFSFGKLRAAAAVVVGRHEALRTSIDLSGYSVPVQLVHAEAEMSLGRQDLRHLPPQEQQRAIRRFMTQERGSLFDLDKPPLVRLYCHLTSGDSWWITITECHPVIEGWSYHLMLMELLTCYLQLLDGHEPDLPPLPELRFADFIAAELESRESGDDRAYWQQSIAAAPPLTPPASWGGGEKDEIPVYDVLVRFHDILGALLDLASRARVPLKSVMHAAHLTVMSMLTIEPSFSTGLVCDGRLEVTGADRVFGMYLNTVPFAFTKDTRRSWLDLVRAVFAREVELWPHRRYPLPLMQRDLADGQRLNQVLFNYLDFHSVDTDLLDIHQGTDFSPNDFQLVVVADGTGMLRIAAHPETVSRPYGELLGRMYRDVLEAMLADPDGPARPRLPAAEFDRVVRQSNDTSTPMPEALVHGLFEEVAHRSPEAVAVVAADGSTVTYRELNERANQLAWHLRGLGVTAEQFVGICVDSSVSQLVALLGILKGGGAYVPLDPAHPADRLGFIMQDTRARVIVTTEGLRGRLPDGDYRTVSLDGDAAAIASRPATDPEPHVTPDNLVYAMYTSGSTGRPKGVMISHRGLNNYLLWAVDGYGLDGAHGAPMLGSIAFDLSIPNFFLPLIGGRDVTLLPPDPSLRALAGLLGQPADFSLLKITPAHLDLLRAQLPAEARLHSVRTFVVGADEVKPETVAAWRTHAPGARIIDEYGPTETVVGCSVYTIPADFDPSAPVPIGKPIANIQMYVLDSDLDPVPTGVVGELYIGGTGVARGYLNRPGLTAERFLPDPYAPQPGARFYRTGDLARLRPDGNLEFLGRIDHQVKIRGYRIELGEIEAQLLLHPGIREAVVAAREDRPGDKRLVGYVVPTGPTPPEAAELRGYLGRSLPAYMLPAAFVVLDALPLSAGGKVDRARLPTPKAHQRDLGVGYLAPRTPTELALAGIWADVLQLDRVGVRDSFLDLGGHSLTALALAGRVQAELGAPLHVASLLQAPTVEAQARMIDGNDPASAATPLVALSTGESKPPVVLVHPAGGNVLCYVRLARLLDSPVYALAAPGLDAAATPIADVPRMADTYLEALAEAALDSGIALGGWSMGGLVAYEMARRIQERTSAAVPLLLFDSYAPGTEHGSPDADGTPFLAWFAYDWGQNLGLDLGVTEAGLAELTGQARLALLLERAQATGAAGPDVDLAALARAVAVVRANVCAAGTYAPPPGFSGPITVFAAAGEPSAAADPAHGWQAWTSGAVQAVRVPGDHYGVLRVPNVAALAEAIGASLKPG
jgi:amino acid adenylation domain-containing protein